MNGRGDLEECAEDAMVAYLRALVPGWASVLAAYDFSAEPRDCVVVYAHDPGPIAEGAEYHDPRAMMLDVAVRVDSSPDKVGGEVVKTVRQRNRELRAAVYSALAIVPTAEDSLLLRLIATQTRGIAWSMAQLGKPERGVDTGDEKRKLVTLYPVEIIIEPQEEQT